MKIKLFLYSMIILMIGESCVSLKKYREMETNYYSLKGQNMVLFDSLSLILQKLSINQDTISSFSERISELQKDTTEKLFKIKTLSHQLTECQNMVEMLSHNKTKEIEQKSKEIAELQNQLRDKERGLELLAAELEIQQQRMNETGKMLADKEKELKNLSDKLTHLENVLSSYQSNIQLLKNKVSDALLGFENSGLSVQIKNSKVYVSLEENLLFQTGSTRIDKKGEAALIKLSRLLEENPDINIMIEGHTDNIPYKSSSGCIKNNWQLSVLRAVAVTEIILNNPKIDPRRVIPCGRADSSPVNTENTSEARAKNRRTEIILTPKLDELFEIISNN